MPRCVFITDNGKQFDTLVEAEAYETLLEWIGEHLRDALLEKDDITKVADRMLNNAGDLFHIFNDLMDD